MTTSLQLRSQSPQETGRIGACLGNLLQKGDIVLLKGDFGAGKTTLVQGIARGLGVRGRVTSPSFALVNEYRADQEHAGMPIYHIDVYRIASSEEALQFGIEEYLSDRGVSLIEWPEKVEEVLPEEHLRVELRVRGTRRRLYDFEARGKRYEELLDEFSRQCGALS